MKTRIDKATYQRLIAEKDFRLATQKMKIADAITLLPNKSFEPSVTKGRYLYENDEEKGILKRTIVSNTYNWLDSHGDVHLNGIFAKSIQLCLALSRLKIHRVVICNLFHPFRRGIWIFF